MFLVSSCSCLCPIQWSQVLSRDWRCSWSNADRRYSNYISVINILLPTNARLKLELWRQFWKYNLPTHLRIKLMSTSCEIALRWIKCHRRPLVISRWFRSLAWCRQAPLLTQIYVVTWPQWVKMMLLNILFEVTYGLLCVWYLYYIWTELFNGKGYSFTPDSKDIDRRRQNIDPTLSHRIDFQSTLIRWSLLSGIEGRGEVGGTHYGDVIMNRMAS